MLQTLKIINLALIDKAELYFDEKLNVISGETGAGKSILLDALSFVFGGRSDKTLIRTGCQSMKVEAIFVNLSKNHKEFIKNETDISCDDEMFLSRELDLTGKNICKINGELISLSVVKKICSKLVDIHGQSEHLSILNNDYQLKIIDLFSKKAENYLIEINNLISVVKNIDFQIKELGGNEQEKQNLIDLYSFQLKEIENANIIEGEEENLTNQKKEMQMFEKISENLNLSNQVLSSSDFENSAVDKISESIHSIQQISNINSRFLDLENRLKSCLIELEDISETISDEIKNTEFDEEKFNAVDERLDLIKNLFRKYGGDYVNLKNYYQTISDKLKNLVNSEERYKELILEKNETISKIKTLQDELSEIRKIAAKELILKMQNELKTLGMPNAKLDVEFSEISEEFSTFGKDKVEFLFSSNLGFDVKPLNKVVSGGEMSRVMLAYKIVISDVDEIQTIIFDEIDSGLSGNVAMVVAEYMARLTKFKQIIAVSHLPQICAMADFNLKVEKYNDNETTHTKATILKDEMLFKEIGRLMGVKENDIGYIASKNLKETCDEYKKIC